jgi:hypothetical protein
MDHATPTVLEHAANAARAIGYALFARVTGLDALGVELPISAWVQIASNTARLGLGRTAQRWIRSAREQEWIAVAARSLAATDTPRLAMHTP